MLSWIRRKFSRRLAFNVGLTLLIAFSVSAFFLTREFQDKWKQSLRSDLTTQARLISASISPSTYEPNQVSRYLFDQSLKYKESCQCRVSFIHRDGKVLADSDVPWKELEEVENHSNRPEIVAALKGQPGHAVRRSETVNRELLYVAVPLANEEDFIGVVRVALGFEKVSEVLGAIPRTIFLISLFVILGTMLVSTVFARSISRPVYEMVAAARRLFKGDYTARVRDFPSDEHRLLGETLNQLAENLQGSIGELSKEKSQLTSILENMVEGVFAVDRHGMLIAMNEALGNLFDCDPKDSLGKPFLDVLRNTHLEKLVYGALEEDKPRLEELSIFNPEEKIFEVQSVPLRKDNQTTGALLVLHDITSIRKLEQIRKDFVANVSHELRTPLASIRGYAETLRSGAIDDKKNRDEFLGIIEKHTDNMERLVEDLLSLALIESGSATPKLEPISVQALFNEVWDTLKPLASKKNVRFVTKIEPETLTLNADRNQLYQAIRNLTENAIKFNQDKGEVSVLAEKKEGHTILSISDTGIGIPSPDIPRLFERFYRVDKARSREMGGTGLGLAIVKHITEAHGGNVSVESAEGRGSKFILSFPA